MRYCLVLWMLIIWSGCSNQTQKTTLTKITGETMGTYFMVSYYSTQPKVSKEQIEQKLLVINQELSTYISGSTISQFNHDTAFFVNPIINKTTPKYALFDEMYKQSEILYQQTNGYFDPTVMPLVNYWGFGYQKRNDTLVVDSSRVYDLLSFVGFSKLKRIVAQDNISYSKKDSRMQLDYSAIAKGYAVDLIAELLEDYDVKSYLVDIGGEIIANGEKPNGNNWIVGISKPDEDADVFDIVKKVKLYNKAMASSGNYRNFYQANGQKYSHTINPKTGFTERNELLSVSIIAKNCMEADALATACMVMGLEKAKFMINEKESTEACFIINKNGHLVFEYSNGFLDHTQE